MMAVEPAVGKACMPSAKLMSSDNLNAAIERVTPDVLALLADGVPRTKGAIIAALAGRHPKEDIKRTIARLDVLGQIDLQGSRYVLDPASEQD
jgi:hypothetical protein